MHRPSPRRRAVGALLALLLAGLTLIVTAGPSAAEDGYRYWNYSHLEKGEMVFAQTGPGQFVPKDGAVEGWRFGTSTVSQGIAPRADLTKVTFAKACAGEKKSATTKRVAILIDYGTKADADGADVPKAEAACAVVPTKATGTQALESVVKLRTDKEQICALDGFPASGCGVPVKDATIPADEQAVTFALPSSDTADSDDSDTPWTLIGVAAAVIVLGGLAVPLYRRNREG
ncbi:SCO2322 family protein [Aeromicrobium terrae]|uniref:LPXTG cell wall anchor domain-containing protein n=1 Tax=Aeromicrobium terrae TaxID=2498846 RepID=A0A5C8NIE5_9ACTN|nr:SCO2322 family protein [Aeromicrobium terrae]TXL57896.1 hypothetical protein FHP06_11170 [Aeromicrobium terrae]